MSQCPLTGTNDHLFAEAGSPYFTLFVECCCAYLDACFRGHSLAKHYEEDLERMQLGKAAVCPSSRGEDAEQDGEGEAFELDSAPADLEGCKLVEISGIEVAFVLAAIMGFFTRNRTKQFFERVQLWDVSKVCITLMPTATDQLLFQTGL